MKCLQFTKYPCTTIYYEFEVFLENVLGSALFLYPYMKCFSVPYSDVIFELKYQIVSHVLYLIFKFVL